MKILIISLLRLGDLIMISGIIRKLADQGYQVDLLVHRETRQLFSLLKGIRKIYEFDRELVQYSVGEQVVPMNLGPLHINGLINNLNNENYERIYNLTNTHLSALFMSKIKASDKIGLNYKLGKFEISKQDALLRLNGLKEAATNQSKHFIDIFSELCEIPSQAPILSNIFSNRDSSEKSTVCLQPLTSDEKKNWGFENWKQLAINLLKIGENVQILCSPKESFEVFDKFKDLLSDRIQIKVLSLSEVLQVLQRSNFLITGDTAIKHLASAVDCPTIEIALGSSNVFETGVYLNNSVILTPNDKCYPCRHSKPCPYPTPICRESVSVETVMRACDIILNKNINNFELENGCRVQTKGQFKLNKLVIHQGVKYEKAI